MADVVHPTTVLVRAPAKTCRRSSINGMGFCRPDVGGNRALGAAYIGQEAEIQLLGGCPLRTRPVITTGLWPSNREPPSKVRREFDNILGCGDLSRILVLCPHRSFRPSGYRGLPGDRFSVNERHSETRLTRVKTIGLFAAST